MIIILVMNNYCCNLYPMFIDRLFIQPILGICFYFFGRSIIKTISV